jgi:hypothetical protein
VWPAVRQFRRGQWPNLRHSTLKERGNPLTTERIAALLRPHLGALTARPLYISLDKDVLVRDDAVVNWESGYLRLSEVRSILSAFIEAAGGCLAGMDVTGRSRRAVATLLELE